MQDYKKLFNEKYNEALNSVLFPPDFIHTDFKLWLSYAIKKHNRVSLDCHWETYKKIYSLEVQSFSLLDMVNATNAVLLSMPDAYPELDYIEIQERTKDMAVKYGEISLPIKETAQKEVQAMYEDDLHKLNVQLLLKGQKKLPKEELQF